MQILLPLFLILCFALPASAQIENQTLEFQLINLVNRYRRSQKVAPLQLDTAGQQVARQHSQDMEQNQYFDLESPQRGSLDYQLGYARVSGRAQHRFIAIGYTPQDIFEQLKTNPALLSKESTHIAVGLSSGTHPKYGKALWATVLLLEYLAEIKNLPRTLPRAQTIRINTQLMPGFQTPRLPVTFPDGHVITFKPRSQRGRQYVFEVPFTATGEYAVELLVSQTRQGPRVATILPIFVGQPYPLKGELKTIQNNRFEDTRKASEYLIQRVNQVRQQHGLQVLTADKRLSFVAFKHSEDMSRRKYFAHINPDAEDPNQRFHKQGGYGQVGENIAFDISVSNAFNQLMKSPGHRANILQRDYTHLGIGVFFDGQHFYITQMFQAKQPAQNVAKVRQDIIEQINRWRSQSNQSYLVDEPLFSQQALIHSKLMAKQDLLQYDVEGLDFSERYLRSGGHYQKMSSLILSASNLEDSLRKLQKQAEILNLAEWNKMGLGVHQQHSLEQGENTLWITLGLASE